MNTFYAMCNITAFAILTAILLYLGHVSSGEIRGMFIGGAVLACLVQSHWYVGILNGLGVIGVLLYLCCLLFSYEMGRFPWERWATVDVARKHERVEREEW